MAYPSRVLTALTVGLCLFPAAVVNSADVVPLERLTWQHRNPRPVGQGFAGIVAGSDCVIIYGGGGMILRSANGVLWDVVPIDFKGSLLFGKFREGEFLLVGNDRIFTSPDGWHWTSRRLSQLPDGSYPYISYADRHGDRWAALTSAGVYVSDNGEDWELWPITAPGGLLSLVVGEDRVLVLKAYFSELSILSATGPDGWTESTQPFLHNYAQMYYLDGQFVVSGPSTLGTSLDGIAWETMPLPAEEFDSLARAGEEWVFCEWGSNRFHTSPDAVNWTDYTCDAFDLLGYIVRTPAGVWVATGDAAAIATSTDGVHWIRRDSGTAPQMNSIARIGERWVAAGMEGTILRSTDGFAWEQQVIGSEHEMFFQMIADEDVVYVSSDQGAFQTSDGVNWEPATALPPMRWDFSGIPSPYVPSGTPVWVDGRWLLRANIPMVAAGALFASEDGTAWSMLWQTANLLTSVAGRPGRYVACVASNSLWFSDDAVQWQQVPLEAIDYAVPFVVLEGHGWFLAGTSSGLLASQNGRDWAWLPGISSTIVGGARIGDSFWFTGEYGTIIEVMPHLEAPLANLSTRAYQRPEGRPTIAGFAVQGDEPVDVLVRAVGAGLRDHDVDEVMEQPVLHLYEGTVETMTAGDWAASPARAAIESATRHVGTFPLAEDGGDAAFTTRLPAGVYTAVVSGSSVEAGNVLVEVYDSGADHGTSGGGRLSNSSTRGDATPDHPLIGGLIISGDQPRRVLLRGIGPGLVPHGVTDAAQDPLLEVYRQQEKIADNDDWSAADDPLLIIDAAAATHAFALPADSRDAALVLTLDPGLYTVHVRPAKDTDGGVVLLETYYVD